MAASEDGIAAIAFAPARIVKRVVMFDHHKKYTDSCGNFVHVIFKGFGVDTDAVVTTPEGKMGIGYAYGRANSAVEPAIADSTRAAGATYHWRDRD